MGILPNSMGFLILAIKTRVAFSLLKGDRVVEETVSCRIFGFPVPNATTLGRVRSHPLALFSLQHGKD
jgi:hypothetical protein